MHLDDQIVGLSIRRVKTSLPSAFFRSDPTSLMAFLMQFVMSQKESIDKIPPPFAVRITASH